MSFWVRQTHRWLSIIFTLTVIANFAVMAITHTPSWNIYASLPPLASMLLTGLYMFVLPYVTRRPAR